MWDLELSLITGANQRAQKQYDDTVAAAATCQQRYEEAEAKLVQVQAAFDATEAALRVKQSNTQQIAVAQVSQSIFGALAKSAFEQLMS